MEPDALARRAGSEAAAGGGGKPLPAPDARKESDGDGDGKKVAAGSNDAAWDEDEEALGALIYKASRAAKARDEAILGKKRRASKEEEPARSKREDRRKESGETSVMPRASSSSATHDADEEALGVLIYKNSRTAKARAQAKNGKTRHHEKPPASSDEGKPPRKKRRRKAKEEVESSREKCAVPGSSARPRRGASIEAAAKLSRSGSDGEQRETSVTRARSRRHVVAIEAATKISGHMLEEDGGSDGDESLGYDSDSSGMPKKQPFKSNKRRSRNPKGKGGPSPWNERQWNERFEQLQAYKAEHGDTDVRCNYITADGVKLGLWVTTQRQAFKNIKGKLTEERKKLLEGIGFQWTSSCGKPNDEQWMERFELLCSYKAEHGHCDIPQSHAMNGFKLGAWVSKQRQLYKEGRLSDKRAGQLEKAGLQWSSPHRKCSIWDERLEQLREYKTVHGHCDVPTLYEIEDVKLGAWVQRQRKRHKRGTILEERKRRLEKIGFQWVGERTRKAVEDSSQSNGAKKRSAAKNGAAQCHCGDESKPDGQEKRNRKTRTNERSKETDEDPDRPKSIEDVWNDKCERLKEFYDKHGHWNIHPSHRVDGFLLASWANIQIQACKRGQLSKARQQKLKTIGFRLAGNGVSGRKGLKKRKADKIAEESVDNSDAGSSCDKEDDSSRSRKMPPEEIEPLSVGDAVLAYYLYSCGKKGEWIDATITNVNTHSENGAEWATYDVEYNDGYTDDHLPDSKIRRCPPPEDNGKEEDSDGEKEAAEEKRATRSRTSDVVELQRVDASTNRREERAAAKKKRTARNAPADGDSSRANEEESRPVPHDDARTRKQIKEDALWSEKFEQLLAYKTEHGHCDMAASCDGDNHLGGWVEEQREQYELWKEGEHSELTDERVAMLESVDFDFAPGRMTRNSRSREKKRDKTQTARKTEVLTSFTVASAPHERPRRSAAKKTAAKLSRQATEGDGGADGGSSKLDKSSAVGEKESFEEADYYSDSSDSPRTRRPKLRRNRERAKAVANTRVEDRMRRDKEGRERLWMENYETLKAFKSKHKHCDVPFEYAQDPVLGRWVNEQRKMRKKNRLAKDRRTKLERIGFLWKAQGTLQKDRKERMWQEMFKRLQGFRKEHGHCEVLALYPDDPPLGRFVQAQRAEWREGQLPEARRELLDGIGFSWQVTVQGRAKKMQDDAKWEDRLKQLRRYKSKKGHCHVPNKLVVNGIALGSWVQNQRQHLKNGSLSEERKKRLDDIGFRWTVCRERRERNR